ncbi:MAG: TIGR04283 family arsenosugar biosynthesis glycosyltransferase [Thermodesulfobacteriota bacterium]
MDHPKFSIIIPVFHEAERINGLIDHLRQLDFERCTEIIVVDGAPEKDTLHVIHDHHVTKVASQKGRGKQMNAGASLARGDILIFLHADTELPVSVFKRMNAFIHRSEFVGGAFDLGIKSDKMIFKLIASLASLRSRMNRIPYGDQVIFIRRDYFIETGGYKDIPLMEDVELMRRVKRSGKKIVIFHDRVMTSPRRWEKEGLLYCIVRNWMLQVLYFLGVSPHKLVKYYEDDDENVKSRKPEKTSC